MRYIGKTILMATCILCMLPLSACSDSYYVPKMPTRSAYDPCQDFDVSDIPNNKNGDLLMQCMIYNYDTMKLREQEALQLQKEMAVQELKEQRSKFKQFKKNQFLENNKAMDKMLMEHMKKLQLQKGQ